MNCEINLNLTCSSPYGITNSTGLGTFATTDKKTNLSAQNFVSSKSNKTLTNKI